MEIKKIIVNGNEYEFVCEYWETSSAWGHKVTLIKGNFQLSQAKVRYYNRTWECYRFQSCMKQTVSVYLQELRQRILKNYKYETGKKRVTEAVKQELYKSNATYNEIMELYNKI